MAKGERGILAQSFAEYGKWADDQEIGQRFDDGAINLEVNVPVAWPKKIGKPEREPVNMNLFHGTIQVRNTPAGEYLFADIHILRNFDELHATAESHRESEPNVFMFEHFHAWLTTYLTDLAQHGEIYDASLFTGIFDALVQHGDEQLEEYRHWCVLDFILKDDNPEKQYSDKHLAVGWSTHSRYIERLYTTICQHPDAWVQAGIPGDPGDWNGFIQYIVHDIQATMDRVMPYLLEAAVSFISDEAEKIVWEETQKAYENGAQDTSYIAMSIFGRMIDEHPWFHAYMLDRVEALVAEEPMTSLLLNTQHVVNPRIAEAALLDEPVDGYVHLRSEIYIPGYNSTKTMDYLFTDDGMFVELSMSTYEQDVIYNNWNEFIGGWGQVVGADSLVRAAKSNIDQARNGTTRIALTLSFFVSRYSEQPDITPELQQIRELYRPFEQYISWFVMKKKLEKIAQQYPLITYFTKSPVIQMISLYKKTLYGHQEDHPIYLKGEFIEDEKDKTPIAAVVLKNGLLVESPIDGINTVILANNWDLFISGWKFLGGSSTRVQLSLSHIDEMQGDSWKHLVLSFFVYRKEQIKSIYHELDTCRRERDVLAAYAKEFLTQFD